MTARVSECCSCERVLPVPRRGLCSRCYDRHLRYGTLDGFGYMKADRMADYARLRAGGADVPTAAARLGVTARTAWRYEGELAASGRAPWRQWMGRAA